MTFEERSGKLQRQNTRPRAARLAIVVVVFGGVAMGLGGQKNTPDSIESGLTYVHLDDGMVLVMKGDTVVGAYCRLYLPEISTPH